MKLLKTRKNILLLLSFILLSFSFVVFANWNIGYKINTHSDIWVRDLPYDKGDHNQGFIVRNTTSKSYFIPTKTKNEWNNFKYHHPNNVSIIDLNNDIFCGLGYYHSNLFKETFGTQRYSSSSYVESNDWIYSHSMDWRDRNDNNQGIYQLNNHWGTQNYTHISDHTSGNGNLFIGDPTKKKSVIYDRTISVKPNHYNVITYYFKDLNPYSGGASYARMYIYANGHSYYIDSGTHHNDNNWHRISKKIYVNNQSSVRIILKSMNSSTTRGNDIGIDDIRSDYCIPQ